MFELWTSKYLQERNMTHWNSVVFFKTCVVVYNLVEGKVLISSIPPHSLFYTQCLL